MTISAFDRATLRTICETVIADSEGRTARPVIQALPARMVLSLLDAAEQGGTDPGATGGVITPVADVSSQTQLAAGATIESRARRLFGPGSAA